MSIVLPGSEGDWIAWRDFHVDLVRYLHRERFLAEVRPSGIVRGRVRRPRAGEAWGMRDSPWTRGGCGVLARVIVEWMNDPRARWEVIRAHRGPWREESGAYYTHAMVVYRSANPDVGEVVFDGVHLHAGRRRAERVWEAVGLRRRTATSNEHMRDSFRCDPWDERRGEIVRQALLARYGRWPR